jgi:hypothetical protein
MKIKACDDMADWNASTWKLKCKGNWIRVFASTASKYAPMMRTQTTMHTWKVATVAERDRESEGGGTRGGTGVSVVRAEAAPPWQRTRWNESW